MQNGFGSCYPLHMLHALDMPYLYCCAYVRYDSLHSVRICTAHAQVLFAQRGLHLHIEAVIRARVFGAKLARQPLDDMLIRKLLDLLCIWSSGQHEL